MNEDDTMTMRLDAEILLKSFERSCGAMAFQDSRQNASQSGVRFDWPADACLYDHGLGGGLSSQRLLFNVDADGKCTDPESEDMLLRFSGQRHVDPVAKPKLLPDMHQTSQLSRSTSLQESHLVYLQVES